MSTSNPNFGKGDAQAIINNLNRLFNLGQTDDTARALPRGTTRQYGQYSIIGPVAEWLECNIERELVKHGGERTTRFTVQDGERQRTFCQLTVASATCYIELNLVDAEA